MATTKPALLRLVLVAGLWGCGFAGLTSVGAEPAGESAPPVRAPPPPPGPVPPAVPSVEAGVADAIAAARDSLERHAREPFSQNAREAALRDLGAIGGEEAAIVVASVLDDPFVHLRDHAVSALVAMLRGRRADATASWLLARALLDRGRPSLRRAAAIALGSAGRRHAARDIAAAAVKEADALVARAMCEACERLGDPAAADALFPITKSKDGALVGSAARAVGRAGSHDAVSNAALRALLSHRHPLARAGAVDGLISADPKGLRAVGSELLHDKAIEVRIALADALGALATSEGNAPAVGLLGSLLADGSWRVRAAAYEAAVAIWDRETIPLLIERLRLERGRLRGDACRALRTVCGHDVGTDPDLWAAWWAVRGGSLDLGPRPPPDRFGRFRRARAPLGKGPRNQDGTAEGAGGGSTTAAFFDLPLASTRLAFLFDYSGSMREPFDGGASEDPGGESKVDLARREFATAAQALPADVVYDVFLYRYPSVFPPAPHLTRALGRLSPGGATSARRAALWLSKEKAMGWGAIYDGLVLCAAEDVDTIVLLSDGVPSRGTYERDDRLIDEYVRANRFRRVAVDTVLVGTRGADRRFMEALADATGGRFEDATRRAARPATRSR